MNVIIHFTLEIDGYVIYGVKIMNLWKILTKIKRIKICGHWHKIIFPYEFRGKWTNLIGQCNHTTLTIKVAGYYREERMAKSRIEEILLHEIIHCVDYHYNNLKLKESEVIHLSEGLYATFKGVNNA